MRDYPAESSTRHCADIRLPQVPRPSPLEPAQGAARRQKPRPQEHRKEVMRP